MDLKRLLKLMMNQRLFIQKRLFLHKRGSTGNMARLQAKKRTKTEKDKTFYPNFIRANNQCGPNENNVLEGITDKNKKELTNGVLF